MKIVIIPVRRIPSKSPALLNFDDKFSRKWDNCRIRIGSHNHYFINKDYKKDLLTLRQNQMQQG